MNQIRCVACRELKDQIEFPFKNKKKGIRSGRCFPCQRAYSRSHYEKNKQYYADKNTENRRKRLLINRKMILEHFRKHPCIDCGETDPIVLQFDHVRGKKSFSIAERTRDVDTSALRKEMAKCEVRCANCHIRRTAKQQRWYHLIEDDLK